MKTVVGLVANCQDAENLIRVLTDGGFKFEDLVRIGTQPEKLRREEYGVETFQSIDEFFGAEEKLEVKNFYAEGVRRGGVLVSVFAEDEDVDRAAEIMIRSGLVEMERWIDLLRKSERTAFSESPPLDLEDIVRAWLPPDKRFNAQGMIGGTVLVYDHS